MRYERKFIFDQSQYGEVYTRLMTSSFFFTEIFHKRTVNNIYLDSAIYSHYYDNLLGISDRMKHRIRWYGDGIDIKKPVLEYKCKLGELGYKRFMGLPPFVLDDTFDYDSYLSDVLDNIDSDDDAAVIMYHDIAMEMPALLNSYVRQYFLSADGKYRITIDYDLKYNSIGKKYNDVFRFHDDNIVLELKYDQNNAGAAEKIIQELGLRMSKNSKYVTGVEGLLFHSF